MKTKTLRAFSICMGCDHFCLNNNDDMIYGCRAFPEGIPDNIGYFHSHDVVIDGQVGDFVYTPAKAKYDIVGDKIEILQ